VEEKELQCYTYRKKEEEYVHNFDNGVSGLKKCNEESEVSESVMSKSERKEETIAVAQISRCDDAASPSALISDQNLDLTQIY
jgi:hypothetical protein